MTEIIHLPGIGNSGKRHWHSLWEDADSAIRRFTPTSFRFPSLIVASTDDPYGSLPYVQTQAEQWGSNLKVIGAAGHINGQSELGGWPEGLTLLRDFVSRV
ncbi:hypothetical protein N183_27820 [Sinorhizobium sp. Sb3]|uniref:RBBP9/YdeN family alpha/beta hydrolase n=1 Tax=Sinorhizobium sp. Sb3 TaxID=1358417 RepID=UPI00071CFBA7|nr:alpha/beta hydrolase [Sinorhizobium sp. Sb3]KSV71571.1 hypothetical protein N183_27820 [Sinorhizobium sp. Sb3]